MSMYLPWEGNVQQSHKSIGLGSTINLVDRLRPLIMLYSPEHPRNQAIILDLAEGATLSIKKISGLHNCQKGYGII
ncbi:MAG: hypothetical protein IH978_02055 [Nitrospinae bacterium]|nr:hypothetical protein [Nitrospinota bacterium]